MCLKNDFLDITPKPQTTKSKIDIKQKISFTSQETINTAKRQTNLE